MAWRACRLETTEFAMMQTFSQSGFFLFQFDRREIEEARLPALRILLDQLRADASEGAQHQWRATRCFPGGVRAV